MTLGRGSSAEAELGAAVLGPAPQRTERRSAAPSGWTRGEPSPPDPRRAGALPGLLRAWALPGLRGAGAPPGPRRAGAPRGLRRVGLRALSLAACVALWQWAATTRVNLGIVRFINVPAPTDVVLAAQELLASPKVWLHVQNSVLRVFAGFLAAAVTGVVLGLLIGRSRLAEDSLLPPLEVLRPIPGVAWIPLAILMFPSSEMSMIFITYLGALFPILLATVHGATALDPRLIESSRSLGARPLRIFTDVVLPGALPSILTGLGVGMGTAWFCLVTAEMIGGQYGIGYYTWEAYNLQRYPDIVLGMLLIGLLGMLSSALVKRVGAWLTPWDRREDRSR